MQTALVADVQDTIPEAQFAKVHAVHEVEDARKNPEAQATQVTAVADVHLIPVVAQFATLPVAEGIGQAVQTVVVVAG